MDTGVPAAAQAPRRRIAIIAVAAVVVVAAAIAVALAWEPPGSPERSLRDLRTAAAAGDWSGVEARFDAGSVATVYVNAALEGAFADDDARTGTTGTTRGMGGSVGVGADMESAFVQRFTDAFKTAIEEGTLSADEGGIAAILLGDAPFEVETTGDAEATARISVPTAAGATEDVVLRMQRADDHWRVVALDGITDLTGPFN